MITLEFNMFEKATFQKIRFSNKSKSVHMLNFQW